MAAIILLKDVLILSYYSSTISDDYEKAMEQDELDMAGLGSSSGDDVASINWFLFYSAVFILTTVDIVMTVILCIGASRDKVNNCRSWFSYGALVLVCAAALLIDALLTDMKPISLLTGGTSFVLYGYTLLLVGVLKEDLKVEKELRTRARLVQQIEFVDAIGNMEAVCPNCSQVVHRPREDGKV